ncbi:MAG: DUF1802 family protein [Gemmatimonadales bacterium]
MDAERTALKEWAAAVDALAQGAVIALVRKGGIRETRSGFVVRHDRFLLYPTYFHENDTGLAPRLLQNFKAEPGPPAPGLVHVTHVAQVARVWHAAALGPLRLIEHEHPLAWPAVESRFHYRGTPGVQVIALRVAKLPAPAEVPELARYRGCVSWVELGQDVDVAGAVPVVADAEFSQRVASITHHLESAAVN